MKIFSDDLSHACAAVTNTTLSLTSVSFVVQELGAAPNTIPELPFKGE
jgi:hypothetical protein